MKYVPAATLARLLMPTNSVLHLLSDIKGQLRNHYLGRGGGRFGQNHEGCLILGKIDRKICIQCTYKFIVINT